MAHQHHRPLDRVTHNSLALEPCARGEISLTESMSVTVIEKSSIHPTNCSEIGLDM